MITNMAKMDHAIFTNGLQVGDFLDTRGVFYAPYNKIKCTWMSKYAIVAHVSSHKQYWSQNAHNIPAHFIVFRKVGESEAGNWFVVKDWEKKHRTTIQTGESRGYCPRWVYL